MNRIIELERKAIQFVRDAESLALRMDERGFHVAFSGGKDSQVLLALVEMAGVKHHAEMQVTTVDSPNLMKFVRGNYPQVKLNLPELNMRQLIVKKKMLPTRQARFCCACLKEQAGAGTCTCLGIRKAESTKRAKRHPIEVLGQRVGYDIENGKLVQSTRGGGNNYLKPIPTQRFIASMAKTRLLFPRFSIGRTTMFGASSRETICRIAICMTKAFIESVVYFAQWLHQKKKGVNLKCSQGLRKRFISVQFVKSWNNTAITTSSIPRNKCFNGGFQAKMPILGWQKIDIKSFSIK
nr:hypothetical protein [Bacteroides pyogenes]